MKFEDLRNYKVKNDKYLNTGWSPSYTLADGVEQISSLIFEDRIRDTADATYSNAAYIRMLHNDE
jgi:hypothetical protein